MASIHAFLYSSFCPRNISMFSFSLAKDCVTLMPQMLSCMYAFMFDSFLLTFCHALRWAFFISSVIVMRTGSPAKHTSASLTFSISSQHIIAASVSVRYQAMMLRAGR